MIELRGWRRRQPRCWLLMRPDTQGWSWLQVADGQLLRWGEGRPPTAAGQQVALILPGTACGHFHLPAPPGLKREEWPLLLEDRLLQGPEAVHTGCVSRQHGRLELVTVERQLLAQWLAHCEGWGLKIERCWSQFQLMPDAAPGSAWCWRHDAGLSLYKGSTREAQHLWLAWPTALGATLPLAWRDLESETFEAPWPPRLPALERLPSLLELRQAPRLRLSLARGQQRLLVGCAVLAVLWGGLWLGLQWRQGALYREQVAAVAGPVHSLRAAAQALKRQRQAQDEQAVRLRQLDQLQQAMAHWLQAQPGWRVRLARFDGSHWRLHLHGLPPPADAPWAAMAASAGAQVAVEPATDELRVVFELGAGA